MIWIYHLRRLNLGFRGWGLIAIFILSTLPYLLFYLVPFLAISALFGWLLYKAGFVSNYERTYSRFAILFPVLIVLAAFALSIVAPQAVPMSAPDKTIEQQSVKLKTKKKVSAPKASNESVQLKVTDVWNEAFNSVYHAWYDRCPPFSFFGDRGSKTSFNYSHFYWIVMSSVLFGAPLVFVGMQWRCDRYTGRRIELEHQNSRLEISKKWSKLRAAERNYLELEKKLRREIEMRDQEIERLEQREKYLTETKVKPVELALDRPDLSYLKNGPDQFS